jgi:hypothetical protein
MDFWLFPLPQRPQLWRLWHTQGHTEFAACAPNELPVDVRQMLHNTPQSCWHLSQDLPATWHHYPWETHFPQHLVVRYSPLPPTHMPARLLPRSELFNFFPVSDLPPQPSWPQATHLYTYQHRVATHRLQHHDFKQTGVVVIFSHGGPSLQQPLLLPQPHALALSAASQWPACLLILACAHSPEQGLKHGQWLLQQPGVNSVMVATHALNAVNMLAFLNHFFQHWHQGTRLDHILAQAQQADSTGQGARRLCLLGRGAVCQTKPEAPSLSPDQVLINVVEGISRQLAPTPHRSPMPRLYAALNIDADEETQQQQLLQQLARVVEQLTPQSQHWVVALMTGLADYDQPDILRQCRRLRHQHGKALGNTPHQLAWWAKSDYQRGNYVHALQRVSQGLTLLEGMNQPEDSAVLMVWVDCLIDLSLTDYAHAVDEQMDHGLHTMDSADADYWQFRQLNGRARLHLKQGEDIAAHTLWQEQQRMGANYQYQNSGDRECAWQLYSTAWRQPEHAQRASQAVCQRVHNNSQPLWLLRALCLWYWRSNDTGLLTSIAAHRQTLIHSLQHAGPDYKPAAFAVAFLHLANVPGMDEYWATASTLLNAQGDHAELAALYRLCGQKTAAEQQLRRFQQSRQAAVAQLPSAPTWLTLPHKDTVFPVMTQCQQREDAWLNSTDTDTDTLAQIDHLFTAGLLPL